MYKQHLLQAIDREIQLAKQLVPYIDETKLDYRLSEKTRTVLELMQYLSYIGEAMMQYYEGGMGKQDWVEKAKYGKETTLQNFADRMDTQQRSIHTYFEKISDEDLFNKEVVLFWKETMPLGVAIIQGPVKWLTTYRMELFKLVKIAGNLDISTGQAWVPQVQPAG